MNSILAATGTVLLCISLNSCLQMPTKIYRKPSQPVKTDSVPVKSTTSSQDGSEVPTDAMMKPLYRQ